MTFHAFDFLRAISPPAMPPLYCDYFRWALITIAIIIYFQTCQPRHALRHFIYYLPLLLRLIIITPFSWHSRHYAILPFRHYYAIIFRHFSRLLWCRHCWFRCYWLPPLLRRYFLSFSFTPLLASFITPLTARRCVCAAAQQNAAIDDYFADDTPLPPPRLILLLLRHCRCIFIFDAAMMILMPPRLIDCRRCRRHYLLLICRWSLRFRRHYLPPPPRRWMLAALLPFTLTFSYYFRFFRLRFQFFFYCFRFSPFSCWLFLFFMPIFSRHYFISLFLLISLRHFTLSVTVTPLRHYFHYFISLSFAGYFHFRHWYCRHYAIFIAIFHYSVVLFDRLPAIVLMPLPYYHYLFSLFHYFSIGFHYFHAASLSHFRLRHFLFSFRYFHFFHYFSLALIIFLYARVIISLSLFSRHYVFILLLLRHMPPLLRLSIITLFIAHFRYFLSRHCHFAYCWFFRYFDSILPWFTIRHIIFVIFHYCRHYFDIP